MRSLKVRRRRRDGGNVIDSVYLFGLELGQKVVFDSINHEAYTVQFISSDAHMILVTIFQHFSSVL
jgi:hypothetical protein